MGATVAVHRPNARPPAQASACQARPADSLAPLGRARVRQAETDAATLRSAASAYMLEFDGCPTVEDLVRERIVSAHSATSDPWGKPFAIECAGPEPSVSSAGPDGVASTQDDIR